MPAPVPAKKGKDIPVNKLISGSVALGLMLTAAACGSSTKTVSTTTTAAPAVTTAATTAVTAGGAAVTTIPTVAGLDAVQTQALAVSTAQAAAAGVTIDPVCLSKVIAKLSDADAQLIVDAGPEGSPTLSTAGEALSGEAQACASGGTSTPGT